MAVNIFEKYGIKQVANVYFEALSNDIKAGVYAGDIVLFLDTLKVSTIETTAENVAAQGGWGNPRLISWDYGKEVNITLTDALMSLESLRFMMGGAIKEAKTKKEVWVKRTAEAKVLDDGKLEFLDSKIFDAAHDALPAATPNHPIKVLNLTRGTRTQIVHKTTGNPVTGFSRLVESVETTTIGQNGTESTTTISVPMETGKVNEIVTFVNPSHAGLSVVGQQSGFDAVNGQGTAKPGDVLRFFWDEKREGGTGPNAVEVTISPSTFPGTYRVVGDTFIRNSDGADEPFQFIIEKAKVQSNVTLTLEAEGDPTTFEMTLQVLRDDVGDEMMKLVRYDTGVVGDGAGDKDEGSISTVTDATETET